MNLIIITPIFPPALGGAAIYYDLLTQALLSKGIANRITVVTEKFPGQPSYEFHETRGFELIRLFPYRAGGRFNKLSQYVLYGIQNLRYVSILNIIRKRRPDVVLVHSSFHNFINLLPPVIRHISKMVPVIADVRDHQLPFRRLHQLEPYHGLIACSLNILEHISQHSSLAGRATHIPVVQERLKAKRPNATKTLAKYGLNHERYFLFAGLIKPGKGIELLLNTYELLRSRGYSEQLVLAGLVKDSALHKRALAINGIHLLGSVSREELLDLMASSLMVINLSISEGMPRTSLEAIALGVRVITPSGIPEFEQYYPDSVACSSDPALVASQIEKLLLHPTQNEYPISQHEPDNVLIQYERIFEKVCSEFTYKVDK